MAPIKLLLASSNLGKLKEFRALASATGSSIEIDLIPGFDSIPQFEENSPTFGENAAGKALYYSKHSAEPVFSDDSGLVVPALDGRPGVLSARYAGPNATSAERNAKLLDELRGKSGSDRAAYFVCTIALARQGHALAIVSDRVDGTILESPRGTGGFGYDPVFYFPPMQCSFAELTPDQKNAHSHRGKAFLRLLSVIASVL